MKLRNVYDALELKSYKEALNLINKLLKKESNSSVLKALKCNALYHQSRVDESVSIAKEIVNNDVEDISIVVLIQDSLWKGGCKEDIALLYEKLSKTNPKNEKFHRDWFAAMVQFRNPSGQQKAAMTLYKKFEKREYIFRAISSNLDLHIANQHEVTPASDKILFGLLAYRMCDKAAKEKKLQNPEEFHLYIECVLAQSKNQEALDLLDGELGRHFPQDIDLQLSHLQLLMICEKWEDLYFVASNAIKDGIDDWQYYDALVEATLKLAQSNVSTLRKGKEYLLDQMKTAVNRNSHLAYVRLISRAFPKELLLACGDYFSSFQNKSVCFEDLYQYILLLNKTDQQSFLTFVEQVLGVQNLSDRGLKNLTLDEVAACVNSTKIQFLLSISVASFEKRREFVKICMRQYTAFLSHNQELEETDNTPGDDILLLAVYTLLGIYNGEALATSVVILEYALSKSKYNYRIRLLLIHLYLTLGAPNQAFQCYQALNIKQIQNDTMSHHFLTRISSIYPSNDTMNFMNGKVRQIYKANFEETPNMICMAYDHGTYSQIRNFFDFRERLEKSLWLYILDIEYTWTVRQLGDLYSVFPGSQPKRWFDNRDQNVLYDATKLGQIVVEQVVHQNKNIGEGWTSFHLGMEEILRAIAGGKDFRHQVSSLRSMLATETEFSAQLTIVETWRINLLLLLSELMGKAMDEGDLEEPIKKFRKWLHEVKEVLFVSIPGWEMLHSCNTILSAQRVMPLFRRASIQVHQNHVEEVARVLTNAEKYLDDQRRHIQDCVETHRDAKRVSDMLDQLRTQTAKIMGETAGADFVASQQNINGTLKKLVDSQVDGMNAIGNRKK